MLILFLFQDHQLLIYILFKDTKLEIFFQLYLFQNIIVNKHCGIYGHNQKYYNHLGHLMALNIFSTHFVHIIFPPFLLLFKPNLFFLHFPFFRWPTYFLYILLKPILIIICRKTITPISATLFATQRVKIPSGQFFPLFFPPPYLARDNRIYFHLYLHYNLIYFILVLITSKILDRI